MARVKSGPEETELELKHKVLPNDLDISAILIMVLKYGTLEQVFWGVVLMVYQ